jgi:hypothetical protein
MEQRTEKDNRVARQLFGDVLLHEGRETLQIEYRYQQYSDHSWWDVIARIGEQEFRISDFKFFCAVAALLNQLPDDCCLVIPHRVLVSWGNAVQIASLEEWLYPYLEDRTRGGEAGGTVVYQLKLVMDNGTIQTSVLDQFGHKVIDIGSAMEQLRRQLSEDVRVQICYFCKYLIEYNDYGGTDYRHDQLYCFRDTPDVLEQVMEVYPILRNHEHLLLHGTNDMDSFHGCPSFSYRSSARP